MLLQLHSNGLFSYLKLKKMTDKLELLETLFQIISEHGWQELSLPEMAQKCGMPFSTFYAIFPSRQAIPSELFKLINQEVIDALTEFDLEQSKDELLFDVFMSRFEHLAPFKAGIKEMLKHLAFNPCLVICGASSLIKSMQLYTDTIGIKRSPQLILKLLWLHYRTLQQWLDDDTDDLELTMVELDHQIKKLKLK
jgi:AcrR family transcriptional regulator